MEFIVLDYPFYSIIKPTNNTKPLTLCPHTHAFVHAHVEQNIHSFFSLPLSLSCILPAAAASSSLHDLGPAFK